jgi:hypothetical protein
VPVSFRHIRLSIHLYTCLPECNSAAPTGRISEVFDVGDFWLKSVKLQFCLKSAKNYRELKVLLLTTAQIRLKTMLYVFVVDGDKYLKNTHKTHCRVLIVNMVFETATMLRYMYIVYLAFDNIATVFEI